MSLKEKPLRVQISATSQRRTMEGGGEKPGRKARMCIEEWGMTRYTMAGREGGREALKEE